MIFFLWSLILFALLEMIQTQAAHQDKRQVEHQDKHQVEHQDKHQDKRQVEHQVERRVELTENALAMLESLQNKALSRRELFMVIRLNDDSRAFKRHIGPLLSHGFIEMTVPDKPNSRLQKYRLTEKGAAAISE